MVTWWMHASSESLVLQPKKSEMIPVMSTMSNNFFILSSLMAVSRATETPRAAILFFYRADYRGNRKVRQGVIPKAAFTSIFQTVTLPIGRTARTFS
jgi:hypothetical protein